MKASDYLAKFLESRGVKQVYQLSGGMITHMLDSICQKTSIQVVTMYHEQAAAFAADASARVTGVPGVAMATSGPGATNLLTGIGSCYFDSVPAIFITGQVNRHEQKGERNIRQLGFQETDIVSMARPITKAAFAIKSENELPECLDNAFKIAMEGRPGPVLIDIPMDVQRMQIEDDKFLTNHSLPLKPKFKSIDQAKQLIKEIKNSSKPLVLAGRGVRASNAVSLFKTFVEKTNLPVVKSLLAVDTLENGHASNIGFIGSYGNRWANIALGECDLLIVIGSRLDIRQTGADTKWFEQKKIYHIDCVEEEINNRIHGCVPIIEDVYSFLENINKYISEDSFEKKHQWYEYISDLKNKWPDTKELNAEGINPNVFIKQMSKSSLEKANGYTVDVGAHQMWAAQSMVLSADQQFITSSGMGAMGFALPAAIGACIASGKTPFVTIIGDGCMMLNIQELQTIVREKLPVKIIVLNNQCLGMIRQFQDSYFESRYHTTYWGYSVPDFAKVAQAFDIKSMTLQSEVEIENAIDWMWNAENKDQPTLLQVMVDVHTNTYPKIAFGKPITEMEPFSKPIEMEGT